MSTGAAEAQKPIKLTTSDNASLTVERKVAERSILIKNLLEDLGGDNEEAIPIPNVCSPATALIPATRQSDNFAGQRGRHEEGSRVVRAPQG